MMAKALKKIKKDTTEVSKWVASEYKYLQDFLFHLKELLKTVENNKIENKKLKQALKDLKYGNYSERRVNSYEKKLKQDIDELIEIVPEKFKQNLRDIESEIEIAANHLIKDVSLYEGDLRDLVKLLSIDLTLLEREQKKQVVSLDNVKQLTIGVKKSINDLTERVNLAIKWLRALSVDLEKAKMYNEELERLATQ